METIKFLLVFILCGGIALCLLGAITAGVKRGKICLIIPTLASGRRSNPIGFWSLVFVLGLLVAVAIGMWLGLTRDSVFAVPTRGAIIWSNWNNDAQKCSETQETPDAAIQHCTQAIDSGELLDINLAVTFTNRGLAYEQKGDYDRAIEDHTRAINLAPNLAPVFANRGSAYSRKGQQDRAIEDYNHAVRLDPDNAEIINERGLLYSIKGDYDRAIKDHELAIQLDPDLSLAFAGRGYTYHRKGDYDRSIRDYNEAIRLGQKDMQVFLNRGHAYYRKGNYPQAIEDFDKAIQLEPGNPQAFLYRGNTYSRQGNYERAIQDYNEVIRLDPKDLWVFGSKGRALFYLRRFGDAQDAFLKAVNLESKDLYDVLWLYLARSRGEQDARNELASNAERLDLTTWPTLVVKLFLGKATVKEVLDAARNPDPKKDREQHCEAYFYLGQLALIQGKQTEAIKLFKATLETGITNFVEYHAAQVELRRLAVSID